MSWLARMALVGGAAELLVAAVAGAAAGLHGAAAALVGGATATSAQVAAVAVLRPGMQARTPEFLRRFFSGVAFRGLSFAVLAALMIALKSTLPPLWMGLGYLGVLLTLLYTQARYLE